MICPIEIAGRKIGPGHPVFVIAELSANHGGDYARAEAIVRAAKDAGADAVKLQTYTPETLTLRCDRDCFKVGGGTLWDGRYLHDLYAEAAMPWEWQPRLKNVADECGIPLFSTPFDPTAVEFLEGIGVPAHKIASFELVDLPLIGRVAATGKPVILSTGMASQAEIREALQAFADGGGKECALLKCTSAYPSDPKDMNLRTIPHMAETFEVPVGLSDHTRGWEVAVAAVALGACIIEKHLTISRSLPGPDSAFSAEPAEFAELVKAVRAAEAALGVVRYDVSPGESASRAFRRSLFAVEDIRAGEVFSGKNVRSIRPGHGLPPKFLPEVLGKRATHDIPRGTPLAREHIEE